MSVKTPPKPALPSGLGNLSKLSGLLGSASSPAKPNGAPLDLALHLIDADPNQPRRDGNPGYTPESLGELAESIKVRGVKSPISVRENPAAPGRYLINHGERRYRASKLAGKNTIRAFIDNDFDDSDQVIENLQRAELTPREIADYIGRKLGEGLKKVEIAKKIGKSPAFVSQHTTLLDLPEPVAEVFFARGLTDVTLINELVKAHKQDAAAVEAWLKTPGREVSRASVQMLRTFLDNGEAPAANEVPVKPTAVAPVSSPLPASTAATPAPAAAPLPTKTAEAVDTPRRAVIRIELAGRLAVLLPNRAPTAAGRAWVRFEDDGQEVEVRLQAHLED